MNNKSTKPRGTRTSPPKEQKLSRIHAPTEISPVDWQRLLRRQFGREQAFGLENIGTEPFFSEFRVRNPQSKSSYRVAIRGKLLGDNHCACPDYATNAGHLQAHRVRSRAAGEEARRQRKSGHELRAYDGALDFVAGRRDAERRVKALDDIFPHGIDDSLLKKLLKVPLYPYQAEGALFAVRAGRALIGDEMGLGKTIQAIAAAEILARHFGVSKVQVERDPFRAVGRSRRRLACDMQNRIRPVRVLLKLRDGFRGRQDHQFDPPTLGLAFHLVKHR